MADLEFSKHVAATGQPQSLPNPIQRHETAQTSAVYDFQGAAKSYAESTNWMSNIGSTIAAAASNKIAQDFGTSLGKNPQGDIGISLTDFDKVMQESYRTQSHATLGLQANKLITDSNIEMAKANRITPDLIAKTNNSISLGLKNIFEHAPAEVKPQLEHQYGHLQLSQLESLSDRMFKEQREDRRNNTALASAKNAENIYSLRLNAKDEKADKAALSLLKSTIEANDADVAAGISDAQTAKVHNDTARASYMNARLISEYRQAVSEKKGDQFLKQLSEKKPDYIPDSFYKGAVNHLFSDINQTHQLRNEYESVKMAEFNNLLLDDPLAAQQQLLTLKDELSPLNYQNTLLKAKTTLQKHNNSNEQIQLLNGSSWSDPEIYARVSDENKDKAFDKKTRLIIENANKTGQQVSLAQAEATVAAQAAGPVPRYTKLLNTKALSNNPDSIEEATRSIDYMYANHKGGNLSGLSEEAKARIESYRNLKDSMPAADAALQSYEQITNKRPESTKIENDWNKFKKDIVTPKGELNYYSDMLGFNSSDLTDPIGFREHANRRMQSYFHTFSGNVLAAKEWTKRDMNALYGESHVNGSKQITYFPIERTLELPSNKDVGITENENKFESFLSGLGKRDKTLKQIVSPKIYSSAGLIQEDIIEHVNRELEPIRQSYKDGHSTYYWEIEPRPSIEWAIKNKDNYNHDKQHVDNLEKYSNGGDIIIHQVWRNGTRDTFRLMVKADPSLSPINNGPGYAGSWDIVLANEKHIGLKNLTLLNQNLYKDVSYKPDGKKLRERYMKHYGEYND